MKLMEMLRQHLEWLDDEDGTMPFPEFEGETGWVSHDDGSIEDWGQYLLRLSLIEVAQLEAENEALKQALLVADALLQPPPDALLGDKP